MELLDQYLEAVRKHLPWQGQDDILAELSANLEAQLEDKEAELGRPLTNEEAQEWLKRLGPPIQMAARYQRQQYLIGPAVFPIYWYVLRLTMAWCAAIYVIAKAVQIAATGLGAGALIGAALNLAWVLLINGAVVTLIFAVTEQVGMRGAGKCTGVMKPPAWMSGVTPPFEQAPGAKKKRSYASALAEVIFGYVFFVWLLLIAHYPFLLLGPGASYLETLPYQLAAVWWPFYWCVVAINGVELIWKTVDLARGAWQNQRRARHLVERSLSLIPLGVLLFAPDGALFLLKNPAADAAAHGGQLAAANSGIHVALTIAFAIVALQLAWSAIRISLEAWRSRAAAG